MLFRAACYSSYQSCKCQKREVGREVFGGDKEGREGKKISLGCATRVKQVRGFWCLWMGSAARVIVKVT